MNCQNYKNEIGPFVEGELSPADGERVRTHLDACDECRAIEWGYRNLSELLSPSRSMPALDEEPAWRRFDNELARRLGEAEKQRRGVFIPLPAAAVLAFLLMGSGWMSLSAHQRAERSAERAEFAIDALQRLDHRQNSLGLPIEVRVVNRRDLRPARKLRAVSMELPNWAERRDPFQPTANETVAANSPPNGVATPAPTPRSKRRALPIRFVNYEYQEGMY